MTSKEIVKRTIHFQDAPRVPYYYINRDQHKSDFFAVGYTPNHLFPQPGTRFNEWGFSWQTFDGTMGQPDTHSITDWADFDAFKARIPSLGYPERFAAIPSQCAEHPDRYIMGGIGITGFNLLTFIRGFEDTLSDFYSNREKIEELLDIIVDFECEIIRGYGELGCIDGVGFGDDWGMQERLMIHPDMWREIFKPRYKKQCDLAHSYGMDMYMHSCGYVYDIIQDWKDAGVDCFNFNEPSLLNIERLGKDFGGKICFSCALNHQRTALTGTREELFAVARELKDNLWVNGGGFIANIENYPTIGMTEERYHHIVDAFEALNP